jgi:hypothetical protein
MLDMNSLRFTLNQLFFEGKEDTLKYVIPMQGNWFVPVDEHIATWIGYSILEHVPITRAFVSGTGNEYSKNVRSLIRIGFVGPQAETFATSTLFWDDRLDVKREFEKLESQINYMKRRVYTRIYKQDGLNDALCWNVDLTVQSFFKAEAHWKPWIPLE